MLGPIELYRRARAVLEALFGKKEWRCWGCGGPTRTNGQNGRAVPCVVCALEGKRWDRPEAM